MRASAAFVLEPPDRFAQHSAAAGAPPGRGAVWLAHLLWEQGVEGSNPFAPNAGARGPAPVAQLDRAAAF